ncbi:hypothetical protein D8M34_06570 [Microbacterium sp. HSID17254]|nr:hypothetical protein D8M34_06570 [Microbacterium sp. HSID17254]
MGGAAIETVRPGVQFTPEAASAFRRAEAQVRAEFGRDIDVNSTYRNWDVQLSMFNAWNRYVMSGFKAAFYPGHSKALHPDDPLAFHTKGTALDSDDWVNARIVAILAENGFIRNRLYVPNERHHFEYLRDRDQNYGKTASGGNSVEDDMFTDEDRARAQQLERDVAWLKTRVGGKDGEPTISSSLSGVARVVQWIKDRIGGSTKTAPTVADELRGSRGTAKG